MKKATVKDLRIMGNFAWMEEDEKGNLKAIGFALNHRDDSREISFYKAEDVEVLQMRINGAISLNHQLTADIKVYKKELEQLKANQPEKVKIPQFVADYIERKKLGKFNLYEILRLNFCGNINFEQVSDWISSNIKTFVLAWLDGYEVEQEKKYRLRLKEEYCEDVAVYLTIDSENLYLSLNGYGKVFMAESKDISIHEQRNKFTNTEIKEIFQLKHPYSLEQFEKVEVEDD
jgi:hypothetical protein